MAPTWKRPAAGPGGRGAGDLAWRPDQPCIYNIGGAAAIAEADACAIALRGMRRLYEPGEISRRKGLMLLRIAGYLAGQALREAAR